MRDGRAAGASGTEETMPAPTILAAPRRLALAALVVAFGGAACGGSTPTTAPTASPTVAPTPTATPFDVSAAFLEIISDPDFSAKMDVDGTMEMGVTATLTGTITGSGDDSRTILTIDVAGTRVETESIATGGKAYSRTAPGPWLEVDVPSGASDEQSLTGWLQTLDTIEDLGVVTKNGEQLHHLSAGDEPVPPGALGLDARTFTDPEVTIDFYAEDDGTPAVFSVDGSWTQLINGLDFDVSFVMDLTLSNVGSPITIKAPSDVWTTYTSPLGYTMSHPKEFTVENRDEYDAYLLDDVEWVDVAIWPDAAGLNAEGFRDAIHEFVADIWGPPVDVAPAVLGGESGFISTFEYVNEDGSEGVSFDVMAMHANQGWDVTFYSLPSEQAADFALLQQLLATFRYSD
jgi:hypothetical protein